MDLILASASPRRSALLSQVGIAHHIEPAAIDETPYRDEDAESACLRFACEKANALANRFPESVILAADTMVLLDNHLLGKPKDIDDAYQMLKRMAGRCHAVLTAFSVQQGTNRIYQIVRAEVYMYPFDDALIKAYIATGEPLDKAGAYGIQGAGALLVERIEGDFYTVVGLPIAPVVKALCHFGITPLQNYFYGRNT